MSILFSTHSDSLPKRFVSEEVVASHLQQLNLASSSSTGSTPPTSSPATTANATRAATTDVAAVSQSPTRLSSSPLSSQSTPPLLTSLDVLASAARACPLSIRTVASCPRSLETDNKDEMVCDDDQICTDNVGDPLALGRSVQSNSTSNYSTVVTSAQIIHSRAPGSLLVVPHQSKTVRHSFDERMNSADHQSVKTSPGHHKRPACVLDEEEEERESEERIEDAEGCGGDVLTARPDTKRSKVDLRYVYDVTIIIPLK